MNLQLMFREIQVSRGPRKGGKAKGVNLYCTSSKFTTPSPTQHRLSSSTATFYTFQSHTSKGCFNVYFNCRPPSNFTTPLQTHHLNLLASWLRPCSKDIGFQWNANSSIGLRCYKGGGFPTVWRVDVGVEERQQESPREALHPWASHPILRIAQCHR